MIQKLLFVFIFYLSISVEVLAQRYISADSLRGMLRPERTCYDVKFYDLDININPATKTIKGSNTIVFKVLKGFNMLQLDLFKNMTIDSIVHKGKNLVYHRMHDAFFVDFGYMQEEDKIDTIKVFYHGQPRIALNAPWDGGITWSKDIKGKDWVAVSCEGLGASVWYPNKDYLGEEPDSMRMSFTVPKGLQCISNGNLRNTQKVGKDSTKFEWFVSYPINNYNVTFYLGDYVHFSDTFVSTIDKEKLPLDYYVLPHNLQKAKAQFKQVHQTLKVMEKYLGKYPYWNDGYALVEAPYVGMEHQSAIAYGNQYMSGYNGYFIDNMDFDYIIMHETAHEWWGNAVSCVDHAEMWLHEAFTTYMEAVFVEETYGRNAVDKYLNGQTYNIQNRYAMIGPYDVNYQQKDSDIYYKGSAMLHTLRLLINDDKKWWGLLKGFYEYGAEKGHVVTQDFYTFLHTYLQDEKESYTAFLDLYLKTTKLPQIQYKLTAEGKDVLLDLKLSVSVKNAPILPFEYLVKGVRHIVLLENNKAQQIRIPNAKISDIKPGFVLAKLNVLK